MKDSISYVGLDVHKDLIQVAVIRGEDGEVLEWRTQNAPGKVRALARKLLKVCSGRIEACYEAGPTGFGLARRLEDGDRLGCIVIAPSLIPKKPGQRVKTDRRDARQLAEYLRAGLLTEVLPPTPDDEARRELCRARDGAREVSKRAKQQLGAFLLRQGRVYREGKQTWTQKHRQWLDRQRFDNPHLQTAFDSLLRAVNQALDRVRELDTAIEAAAQEDAVREAVTLLKCFKGIQTTTAMALVTELYSFERFDSPRRLMAFLGMTPSEHSSSGEVRRGQITKAGNRRVRRLLVEAAWCCTRSNTTGSTLRARRKDQPGWAIDVAERAQHRLHRRFWALVLAGKHRNKAVMAIARELVGFIWVILAKLKREELQEVHG